MEITQWLSAERKTTSTEGVLLSLRDSMEHDISPECRKILNKRKRLWEDRRRGNVKSGLVGFEFCTKIVEAINRNPNRSARVKFDASRTKCRVVDSATPIRDDRDTGRIVGWKA